MRALFASLPHDPREALLQGSWPQGEPWGWVVSALLWHTPAAPRLLQEGLSPGLASLLAQALIELQEQWQGLKQQHPLPSFGHRPPTPAEAEALQVLQSGSPQRLQGLFQRFGYGAFAQFTAFRFGQTLEGVSNPDPAAFEQLVGYERQTQALRRNAERFLQGKPAVPTLLYGARGCGKSTAVKALRTQYHPQGLRLIEVLPEGLLALSSLLEQLRVVPFAFVLYLDDLSLQAQDPRFHPLKALLEGTVYAKPPNVWVLATSNRRNLVTESWADRPDPGAEPHSWDTLQDKLALADRFGLVLTFPPFDKKHYLKTIEHGLGRPLQPTEEQTAIQFAADGRGFSGRTARQFLDWTA